MPSPFVPSRDQRRGFDEAHVRALLGELLAELRPDARKGARPARIDALREALALRPLRGGAFSSAQDLFSELLASWTTDAARLERLVAAPEGALAARLAREVRRLARDVGIARHDPRAQFQKSLAAALLVERRAPQPRIAQTAHGLRLLPAAEVGPHAWPDDVDDPARAGFLSRAKLVSAALAALAEARDRTLSRRALRQAIGRRYALDSGRAERVSDDDALADPRSPATDAVHFNPGLRAEELLPHIPPEDARFWIACSELLQATAGGAPPDARAIAQQIGCSEKTVQRWMNRARSDLAPLTQSTSLESMQRYLHAIAQRLRAAR